MIKRLLPSCLWVSALSCIGNKKNNVLCSPEARIIQFLSPIHDTADTQRHSGNNLYVLNQRNKNKETTPHPQKNKIYILVAVIVVFVNVINVVEVIIIIIIIIIITIIITIIIIIMSVMMICYICRLPTQQCLTYLP